MLSLAILQEAVEERKKVSEERRILTSKLESLAHQLELLVQKKIRLDLEIRKTKKTISKLKKRSSTVLKTSISLENGIKVIPNFQDRSILNETIRQPMVEIIKLEEAIQSIDEILLSIQDLPLYEDN